MPTKTQKNLLSDADAKKRAHARGPVHRHGGQGCAACSTRKDTGPSEAKLNIAATSMRHSVVNNAAGLHLPLPKWLSFVAK